MTRYRGTLAYDGTAFCGFQRQADGIRTVQAVVEAAVSQVTGQPVTISGAGRTDTGVHATGQVIAFDVGWKHSADALLSAINAVLPDDAALSDLSLAGEGFHPRFSAESRVYKYTVLRASRRDPLLRQRAWHVWAALDAAAMQTAAALLVGEHDFASFGKPTQGSSTVRRVLVSRWQEDDRLLVYTVEANGFLQHMVRRIVGVLVAVGRGALTVDEFESLFRAAVLATSIALAPPQGLVLEQVKYPGETRPRLST